ncbi:Hpt domain-containing protein [Archangium sp.]|jgi:HPt (histidine-containing phosphotransfer) domain-containing protein|uniref:Hpt domain-containing protein n=1 Tax=Archangium sp. TaxID=1872627 RepID=UPI002ED96E47
MSQAQVIDFTMVESLRALEQAGEPGLMRELIDTFLENAPERLSRLSALAEQGSVAGLEAEAHALSGSCGALGLEELRLLCRQAEKAASVGSVETEVVAALGPAFERAREVLTRIREQAGG